MFRVFSIPVRFFAALLVCSPWGLMGGEVVTAPVPEFSSPALIPYPSKVVRGKGGVRFKSVHVHLDRDVPRRDDLVREMKDVFGMFGIPASVSKDVFEEGSLTWELSLDAGIEGEAYILSVAPEKATVRAGSFGGFFNALQTLRQLVSKGKGGFFMPSVQISDEPAFALRGMMLDVGRYYMSPAFIKELMRRVSRYKINTLHLHLTDDPAWRLEVKKFPALTDRVFHWKSRLPGKFYTQEQLKELVDYCAGLNIQVIPEIDMPGHMTAALASYPELGCTGGPYVITPQPGVRRDILCAGNPAVFDFVEKVLEEVIGLFPSKYIHIGGDESPRTRWRECPECQSLIRRAGLKADTRHSAEDKLQGYFNTRIEKFLSRHGRRLIGWDEIVDGGMSPDATVMSWRGTEGGIAAAAAGHHAVMTPSNYCYLDFCQDDPTTEPVAAAAFLTL